MWWLIPVAIMLGILLVVSTLTKSYQKKQNTAQQKNPKASPPSTQAVPTQSEKEKAEVEKKQREKAAEVRKKQRRREELQKMRNEINALPDNLRALVPDTERLSFLDYYLKALRYNSLEKEDLLPLFYSAPHPFLSQYGDDLQNLCDRVLNYIRPETERYSPVWSFHTDGTFLNVTFETFFPYSIYHETSDHIEHRMFEQESYHDGGGSWGRHWKLVKTNNEFSGQIIDTDTFHNFRLPPCDEARLNDNRVLLKNPFDMEGIFSFYSNFSNRESYVDEEETVSIGIKE